METQDMQEIQKLKTENDVLKKLIDETNAEKIALDQMYVQSLKEILQTKKQAILSENELKKCENKVLLLTQENDVYKKEIERLKSIPEDKEKEEKKFQRK